MKNEIERGIFRIQTQGPRNRNALIPLHHAQSIRLQVMFSFYILIVTNLTVNES